VTAGNNGPDVGNALAGGYLASLAADSELVCRAIVDFEVFCLTKSLCSAGAARLNRLLNDIVFIIYSGPKSGTNVTSRSTIKNPLDACRLDMLSARSANRPWVCSPRG